MNCRTSYSFIFRRAKISEQDWIYVWMLQEQVDFNHSETESTNYTKYNIAYIPEIGSGIIPSNEDINNAINLPIVDTGKEGISKITIAENNQSAPIDKS